ncbi:hypothetical protein CLOP_g19460 [Closterium sp. NIES-67]|nr:hypothetical protein CLOP_g19460 [Closterium sp. NIES-67]
MKLLKPGTWTPKNWNPWSVGFLKRWKVPEEIKVGDKLVFKWTSKANVYLYNGGDEGDYDACVKNSERGTMLAPTSRYGRYAYQADQSCVTLFFASTVACKKGLKFKTSVAC